MLTSSLHCLFEPTTQHITVPKEPLICSLNHGLNLRNAILIMSVKHTFQQYYVIILFITWK